MLFHCLLACIASDDKLVAIFIVIFLCASPYPASLATFNSLSLDFRSLSICFWVVLFILFFFWIHGLLGSVSWFSDQIGKKVHLLFNIYYFFFCFIFSCLSGTLIPCILDHSILLCWLFGLCIFFSVFYLSLLQFGQFIWISLKIHWSFLFCS